MAPLSSFMEFVFVIQNLTPTLVSTEETHIRPFAHVQNVLASSTLNNTGKINLWAIIVIWVPIPLLWRILQKRSSKIFFTPNIDISLSHLFFSAAREASKALISCSIIRWWIVCKDGRKVEKHDIFRSVLGTYTKSFMLLRWVSHTRCVFKTTKFFLGRIGLLRA